MTCMMDSVRDVLSRIPDNVVNLQIIEHGVLRIERRWVDVEMPETEVMDALKYAFAFLSRLVIDVHTLLPDSQCPFSEAKLVEQLLLMEEVGNKNRVMMIALKTGDELRIVREPLPPIDPDKIRERYGNAFVEPISRESLRAMADSLFSFARRVFIRDGDHITVALFLRDFEIISLNEFRPADRMEKYIMTRVLASEVERLQANAVVFIGEAWVAPVDLQNPFQSPQERSDRTEELFLCACSVSESDIRLAARIRRDGDRVWLEDTVFREGGKVNLFELVRGAWRKMRFLPYTKPL